MEANREAEELVLPPDYHTHTFLCKHAEGAPVDYAFHGARRRLAALAATDHCPMPGGYDPEHRMGIDQFPDYVRLVETAGEVSPIPLLFGIEVDWVPEYAEDVKDWVARQGFDLVLGSVHFLDYWAFDDPAQRYLWESADVAGVWRRYFDMLRRMVEMRLCTVVAHFDLPKKFGRRPPPGVQKEIVLPVLDVIAETGLAIEINTSGLFHPVGEVYPSPEILSWVGERKIPVTFGSDAHTPERVGTAFDLAVTLARECGVRSMTFERSRGS